MLSKMKFILYFLVLFSVSVMVVKAQDEIITNQEIIALTKAGFSKVFIVQKIQTSKSTFNVSTPMLIELKNAGVDEEVIAEMLKANPTASNRVVPLRATANPPTIPAPQKPLMANSSGVSSSSGSDNPVDPVCLKALVLDRANTSNYTENICSLVRNVVAQNTPAIDPDNAGTLLLNLFSNEFLKRNKISLNNATRNQAALDFFVEAEKKRTDKQVGSNPNSSGTTSLAVKGGAPSVIGWAVEQGAATSSISGNTVTIRVNPFGLGRALQGQGFFGSNFIESLSSTNRNSVKPNNFLRKFSAGFSFDTTRGQSTPTFIISKQQLSAVSARFEFINQRNPQSKRARNLFNKFVPDNADIYKELGDTLESLKNNGTGVLENKALRDWLESTNPKIQALDRPAQKPVLTNADLQAQIRYEEAVRGVIEESAKELPVDEILKDSTVKRALERFIELTVSYVDRRKKFTEEINKGTIMTFEYTNNREPIVPDTSNFRFIWENGQILSDIFGKTDLTFNSSLTMYNKKPSVAGVKRIRDFQFALQTDTTLGNVFGTGDTTLTFAGRYERLNGDTIDALGVITPNTNGDVAVGQLKLTIPIADFGIKLPLSVTFANRTDLVKESTVRANFGFTFDLDPLFARLKPF